MKDYKNTKYKSRQKKRVIRNEKGQYTKEIDWMRVGFFTLMFISILLLVTSGHIKIVDKNTNEVLGQVYAQTINVTTTQSPQITTPTPKIYTKDEIKKKICDKFGKYCDKAIKIATCESKLNPDAWGDRTLNPSSIGLFQIRQYAPKDIAGGQFVNRPIAEVLYNIDSNIDWAYKISGGGINWNPWTCNKLI